MQSTSNCPKCSRLMSFPPAADELAARFPYLTVDTSINRRALRCKHCEELAAHIRSQNVELPPPTYKNPLTKLERDIKRMEELIKEDILADRLRAALPEAKRRWALTVRQRELDIRQAWKPFWSVWGSMPGQEGLC